MCDEDGKRQKFNVVTGERTKQDAKVQSSVKVLHKRVILLMSAQSLLKLSQAASHSVSIRRRCSCVISPSDVYIARPQKYALSLT